MTLDLRKSPRDDVVDRVQRALDVRFDRATEVLKRRSVGLRTDRDTWVRIEVRTLDRMELQGGNGVECASILNEVAKPEWYQSVSWIETADSLIWRADETEFISARPVKPGGTLTLDPDLSESWWSTWNASLNSLARYTTTRIAGTQPVTQAWFSSTISQVFPDVDATIDEWRTAHGDLTWANLTAPRCYFLDWEDWGTGPRGLDAATLWAESLAVPTLADRIYQERQADLDSRSGKLARLFECAYLIAAGASYAGPLFEPANAFAADLLNELQT
jgi:hypothetical protein